MKRSWNWSLWIEFLFALAGFLSYTFFAQFPVTRDLRWANLFLFCAGGILLVLGLVRAFGKPKLYRGKIFGPILAVLGVLVFGFFSYLIFYELRQVRLPLARRASEKKRRRSHCRTKTISRFRSQIFYQRQRRVGQRTEPTQCC